jgi:hypothetical protein
LFLDPIELIGRECDDQLVTKAFGPLQEIDVADVEQVECPVCEDCAH